MSVTKVIGNLSLRRFFLFANAFCDGYSLYQSSSGRVKLVARSIHSDFEYQSKVYSNYRTYIHALDCYLNSKFQIDELQ